MRRLGCELSGALSVGIQASTTVPLGGWSIRSHPPACSARSVMLATSEVEGTVGHPRTAGKAHPVVSNAQQDALTDLLQRYRD